MATWQEPIFDRTQDDVDYAKAQLSQKINNVDLKGCLNASDLNRIESNIRYLADTLTELLYMVYVTTNTAWTITSLPSISHINRVISNVNMLWVKYYKPTGSVDLPDTLLSFEDINAIEKNIHLLKEMLDEMVESFKICGTFNCGED